MKKLKKTLGENEKELVAAILKKRGEITACSNCGGIDLIVPPNSIDASISLESLPGGSYYCKECGFEGIPTLFDKERSYEKFYTLRRGKYNKGEGLQLSSNYASGSLKKD